jgi:hypothetical protein
MGVDIPTYTNHNTPPKRCTKQDIAWNLASRQEFDAEIPVGLLTTAILSILHFPTDSCSVKVVQLRC